MFINGINVDNSRQNFIEGKEFFNITQGNMKNTEEVSINNDYFSKAEIDEITRSMNKVKKILDHENTVVEYEVHSKFNQVMLKVVDKYTQEVIFEVPPRKILDVVASICEMAGILVNKQA